MSELLSPPLTVETYEPLHQQQFVLRSENRSVMELTLTEIKKRLDDDTQRAFSLLFRGPKPLLPQGIYRLAHSQLGEVDLFLVPIRQVRDGFVYEAVFNLLKETEPN